MLRSPMILPKIENTTLPHSLPHHTSPTPCSLPPLSEVWLRAGSTGSIPPHTALGVCCNTRTALCLPTHSPLLEHHTLGAEQGMMVWDGHSHCSRGLCRGQSP